LKKVGIYQGHFLNDKKEGYGVMKYGSGEVYEGAWVDDQR
jgi:hypothetical protein